ncbi:protein kinase domain-containing protein [Streptomyces sp. 4N509B]|uniref:protein kinase domain-containing protein n=1 Tax=Streptomyces sp. 4N509B TaxID=3457413 RepID=UPI003FD4EBA7
MAQEQGAPDSGDSDQEPRVADGPTPPAQEPADGQDPTGARAHDPNDSPEQWGDNGLVGEGRYRLTHRLGRGGMAEVFAAEDLRLGRPVAIKLLRADLAGDAVAKARFTREAQSVAGLNHHAVVAVYDSGEEYMRPAGAASTTMVPYIVMELVHGRTIRELLVNADAPPPEQALIIVSGVLEALAYSHQQGIVHRDIKPANVIITETGTVKVMDFGIARALHGVAQTMTATGMVMGTPQYLSPEQALGKTVDTRSDLYAVGCMLYELLALRPPFVGETPLSVVYQHVQDMPRVPSEHNPDAPPELDGLVMRSLAKDPDDRFQTAEEMRGVVQYALRMLEEHGGHSGGLWSTGPTTGGSPDDVATAAHRVPGHAGTRSGARPGGRAAGAGVAATSQFAAPMLLGDPDAGGDGGGGHRGAARGGGRGRMILVALLAVVAIATGVLVAANLGGGDNERDGGTTVDSTDNATPGHDSEGDSGGRNDDDPDPTEDVPEDDDSDEDEYVPTEPTEPTQTEPTEPTSSPTEEETEPEETATETEDPEPSDEPTEEPTDPEPTGDPTEEPTEEPTTTPPTDENATE